MSDSSCETRTKRNRDDAKYRSWKIRLSTPVDIDPLILLLCLWNQSSLSRINGLSALNIQFWSISIYEHAVRVKHSCSHAIGYAVCPVVGIIHGKRPSCTLLSLLWYSLCVGFLLLLLLQVRQWKYHPSPQLRELVDKLTQKYWKYWTHLRFSRWFLLSCLPTYIRIIFPNGFPMINPPPPPLLAFRCLVPYVYKPHRLNLALASRASAAPCTMSWLC